MAMLVTPAAAGYLLARRFVDGMIIGAIIGSISAIVGLYLSYYMNIPSGPAMVFIATGVFAVAAAYRRRTF